MFILMQTRKVVFKTNANQVNTSDAHSNKTKWPAGLKAFQKAMSF